MTWVRLDDRFDGHPKVTRAGNEATGVYVRSLTHAANYLTDGHIDHTWLRGCAGSPTAAKRVAEKLVSVGLWEENGNGWQIHDYLDLNPSRKQVLARREEISRARSEAGRKGAATRWQTR